MQNQDYKKVIVTGATGFIGQNLIPYLLEKNYNITAVSRDREKAKRFKWFSKVKFIKADINNDPHLIDIGKNIGLFHLAWQGLPNYNSLHHFEENLPKNYSFLKKMVKSGINQILVTGTCFEYGFQSGPISSKSKTDPKNAYAIAKDNLRQHLELLNNNHSFLLQWARLFYMYGDGQSPHSIIPQLDTAINNNKKIFNMSKGEQLRDYLAIEEVVKQLHELYENSQPGTYNICSGKPTSIRKLVEKRKIERKSDINFNFGYYPYPNYEPMAFWGEKDEK